MRCPSICNPSSLLFKLAPGWLISAVKERYALFLDLANRLPAHPGDPLLQQSLWQYELRDIFKQKQAKSAPPVTPQPSAESSLVAAHKQMDQLTKFMGEPEGVLQEEQFDKFRSLIEKASAYGLYVVVVDMPLPSWHRQKSPFFTPYEIKLRAILENYLRPGVVDFVSLTDAIPDDEFRDSVHPSAEAANHWASKLVERLQALQVRRVGNLQKARPIE